MQVVVDSLLTSYQRLGNLQNQTVVIIHGWADSSNGWKEFGGKLAEFYDVVLLDLPGFGGTDNPPSPWGLDEYAVFVRHFLDKIAASPYAVIGHSNGGAIAIRGLANGALQADRLVLLASAGVRTTYKGRKKAIRLIAKTGKVLVMPLPESIKKRLRRKLYTTVGSDMLVAEHLQETFRRIVSDDIQVDAAKLTMPVLLVYGEDDVATPPAYGRLLHQSINGSTLEILGSAEHLIHRDQPARVLELVQGFLA